MNRLRRWGALALDKFGLGLHPARTRMDADFSGVVEATRADIPDIVELELPIFQEHRAHHPDDFRHEMTANWIAEFYRQATSQDEWGAAVFVAKNTTLGYVAWTISEQFEGHHVVIHSIGVDPAIRRKGVAQALLDFAETAAAKDGLTTIRANVWAHNEGSRAFFAKNGFYPITEMMGRSVRGAHQR